MSFRLTDIAEEDNRSLRCEINLANVTLSSAYWNGNQTRVDDCDLDSDSDTDDPTDNDNIAESELFRRFPMSDVTDGSTYLLLPEGTIENHRTHKAAGLLISHYILEQLFPGHNKYVVPISIQIQYLYYFINAFNLWYCFTTVRKNMIRKLTAH